MFPYAAECKDAPTAKSMVRVANAGARALAASHGTRFTVGSVCKTIYMASGSTVDWAYEIAGVKYPFAVELRDTGRYGFLLPAKYIVPSGQETFEGVLAMAQAVLNEEKSQTDLKINVLEY